MQQFENQQMKVTINENGEGKLEVKAFGDVYGFTVLDNGSIKAGSSIALSKAMKAKRIFGFTGGKNEF